MPTYDYICDNCGHTFEELQHPDTLTESCPSCLKKPRRLIGSGAGLIFKGPGFYSTDYRKSDVGGSFIPHDPDCS